MHPTGAIAGLRRHGRIARTAARSTQVRVAIAQPLRECSRLGFGRKVLEGVDAARGPMAVDGPEMRVLRLAWFDILDAVASR